MHFYNRNAKAEDIETFRKNLKLETLGMPEYIGMGSHDIETVKHRFIVLPRFGRDIYKIFVEQNHKFPLHTVFRLGCQVTNVLEYIHNREYVHMDIKGANILLGFGKGGDKNVYLLDFGLACHYNTKVFKPDPKKMHNGTIEYTSRDAHLGVPTMRGDLEVLAYNLIEWSGAKLPWVEKKMLTKPVEVQKSKEDFMNNFEKSLKAAYGTDTVPGQISAFFKYLLTLKHDAKPDYSKIREMFEAGIKELSQKNSGTLEFVKKSAAPAPKKKAAAVVEPPNFGEPSKKEPVLGKRSVVKKKYVDPDSESEEEVPAKKVAPAKKTAKKVEPEQTRVQKRVRDTVKKVLTPIDSASSDEEEVVVTAKSPQKKPRVKTSPRSTSKENDEEPNVSPPQKKPKSKLNDEASTANGSGFISLKSKSSSKGNKKTIQLNFNLDVSMDSDVVVVVNRNDKKKKEKKAAVASDEESQKPQEGEKWSQAGVYKGKQAKTK